MNRRQRFFYYWYQPNVYMTTEDWIYIGLLIWVCVMGFAMGLLLGWVWLLFI